MISPTGKGILSFTLSDKDTFRSRHIIYTKLSRLSFAKQKIRLCVRKVSTCKSKKQKRRKIYRCVTKDLGDELEAFVDSFHLCGHCSRARSREIFSKTRAGMPLRLLFHAYCFQIQPLREALTSISMQFMTQEEPFGRLSRGSELAGRIPGKEEKMSLCGGPKISLGRDGSEERGEDKVGNSGNYTDEATKKQSDKSLGALLVC